MINLDALDWSRCTYPPFDHQITGVRMMLSSKWFGLFDEMGAGKSYQVITAACFRYEHQEIDAVVIICPAQVKDVWAHESYSQIIEHSFVKGIIHEFTSRTKALPGKSYGLLWIVTSVEILRNPAHVKKLLELIKGRTFWAIVDESSTISNWRASQTKGCMTIKPKAKFRTILNGTPIGNSPLNIYSQMAFLDETILGYKNFFAFRNHHCQMGGWMNKQVVGFHHLEEVQNKIKPFVLRRLKRDCMDLPERLDATLIEIKLSQATWAKYVSMREEFVAYVSEPDGASVVSAAPVKALRLAQICSGFLGGVESDDENSTETRTEEISCELTQTFLDNYGLRLEGDENYKLIVWCRFRPEIARLERLVRERYPGVLVRVLQGGLSKIDREKAVSLFHPSSPDPGQPALLIGQPQAGRFGLNFAGCSNVDRLSTDYSLLTYLQSNDRVDRPGQKFCMRFQNYVVVGPNRERTVSGIILKALKTHEDVATWTCAKWRDEVLQENSDDIPF